MRSHIYAPEMILIDSGKCDYSVGLLAELWLVSHMTTVGRWDISKITGFSSEIKGFIIFLPDTPKRMEEFAN